MHFRFIIFSQFHNGFIGTNDPDIAKCFCASDEHCVYDTVTGRQLDEEGIGSGIPEAAKPIF